MLIHPKVTTTENGNDTIKTNSLQENNDVHMPPTINTAGNHSDMSDGSLSWSDFSEEESSQPGTEDNSQSTQTEQSAQSADNSDIQTSAPNEQSAFTEAENEENLNEHDETEPQTSAGYSPQSRAKENVNPPYGSNNFSSERSANKKMAHTKTNKVPRRGNTHTDEKLYSRLIILLKIVGAMFVFSILFPLVRPNAICDWGFRDFRSVCPGMSSNNSSSQFEVVSQAEEVFVQLMDPRRPSAKSIHNHKCALETLGYMIEARDDIEHKDLIEKAINSYVEKALVTIDVLIMFEARAKGSIDRFLLFTPSAIDAWSPWSVKNQADIVKEYIEQVDAELKYIREAAMLAHGMLFETNEDLVTVAKYSMKSLSNLNMPAESRLDMLWDLVAGSSSMSERRYLENREILASVVNATKEGTASLGNIVLLIKNFQHTLDDLKRSTSQGLVTKPNAGQLQMIRKAIERLEETRRGFDRKLPSAVESDNLLN